MKEIYPFSRLVGQEKMKLALILSVINPNLGGVLIRGEKGTAKSTAVRALSLLLPEEEVVGDCLFFCHPDDKVKLCADCRLKENLIRKKRKRPLVELPIGATEDRVLGSINLEAALKDGKNHFEPGLLAAANRGLLYIDEVNLLDDHVVDVILDAAAMGQNIVEREGISISHPARFTLIGTMNPEEGELRPQLLDRFGLCVEVKGLEDILLREEVIKRRLAFEKDPKEFIRLAEDDEKEISSALMKATEILERDEIIINDEIIKMCVDICLKLGVDGHRGDLTLIKTALTLAAFNGQKSISEADIMVAAELALPHRMRRQPFQDVDFDVQGRLNALL